MPRLPSQKTLERVLPTYERNVLRVELPDGAVQLTPADASTSAVPLDDGPRYVISTWSPHGRPADLERNLRSGATVEAAAAEVGRAFPAAVHDAGLAWVEGAVALAGVAAETARAVAERAGQPAYFRWDAASVTALRTDDGSVLFTWLVLVQSLFARPCVMEVGERAEPCKRRGGPWTSGSIAAAFHWQLDYRAGLTALGGCDVCHGAPRGPGGPIGLTRLSLPSRWRAERKRLR